MRSKAQLDRTLDWIHEREERGRIVECFDQPLTAKHITHRTGLTIESVNTVLRECIVRKIVRCTTADSQANRLLRLTQFGSDVQRQLLSVAGRESIEHYDPKIDWALYRSLCYTHRSAVVRALYRPMRPPEIQKSARASDPTLRMSTNNVRDIIRILLDLDVIKPVWEQRSLHPKYTLTPRAEPFRQLLIRAHRSPKETAL